MKVALAYSTKDRVELTERSMTRLNEIDADIFWNDGSQTENGKDFHRLVIDVGTRIKQRTRVTGGADAAIVFALTQMLADPSYTHVGLLENDVLLTTDWFERTMDLFAAGDRDGLCVGAVTARTYEDRILIQRDSYAVLHNAGAGHIIFTRKAAELVLEFYRTGWWPDNRAIFSQLSGLDIGQWGAFRTYDTAITADWHFDTILAAHGYATLGLTPSAADMIGQDPPLEEQGLKLATEPVDNLRNESAFRTFAHHTRCVRDGHMQMHLKPWLTQRSPSGANYLIYFAHQLDRIGGHFDSDWQLKWSQGFGPFSCVSNGAMMDFPMFGPCCVLMSGGETGARVKIRDCKSGYELSPELTPEGPQMAVMQLQMPGGMSYRTIQIEAEPGARLFAVQTNDAQPWFPKRKFDYSKLPKVK